MIELNFYKKYQTTWEELKEKALGIIDEYETEDNEVLKEGGELGEYVGEIILKDNQVGSSIMPGKVNPVVVEMAIMNAHQVMSNDVLIGDLVKGGNLELNAFVPMIGETLLESLELLTNTIDKFNNKCAKHIDVNRERCLENLEKSHSLITPLITLIGYDKASKIVKEANQRNMRIKGIILENGLFSVEELETLLNPLNITKPGIPRGDYHE